MSEDDTLPPHSHDDRRADSLPEIERRRVVDKQFADIAKRFGALEGGLAANTRMTADNTVRLNALASTMDQVKTGNDALLEMKTLVEKHIAVMCTWARWFRRATWGLLSLAGVVLPVAVGLKQLGFF